jgi:hypothetical protein
MVTMLDIKSKLLEAGWKCHKPKNGEEVWLGKWMSVYTTLQRAWAKQCGKHHLEWAKTHPDYCQRFYGAPTAKCTECDKEASYDKPTLLCEEHWMKWWTE